MKQFYFLAGIPRSGSTVLASLLNQNSSVYVTPTSPLIDLLYLNEQEWNKTPSVMANRFPEQILSISNAIISGCWEHIPQNIIIDKHRAWCRNIPTIQKVFNQPAKVIITVRDIPSVIASFMTLLRNSKQNPHYIDRILLERNLPLVDELRADVLWNEFIYDPWDSFRTGFKAYPNNLLLVDYDSLVNAPEKELNRVYEFIGLEYVTPNIHDIKCETKDDDLVAWGLEGLHTIRPQLKKVSKTPQEILGESIYRKYADMKLEFWV